MANLTIHALDMGDIQLDSSFLNWQTNCGTQVWSPTTAWLITGGEKPILVDTSFRSVDDAAQKQGLICRRSEGQTLDAQLGRHRLKPADIGYVIHTHLHMDHAGQDYLLPNARILIQRKELQNAAAPNFFPAQFYDRMNVARLVEPLWDQVDLLDGEGELFQGIRTAHMPGHTPAHQAIYVENRRRNRYHRWRCGHECRGKRPQTGCAGHRRQHGGRYERAKKPYAGGETRSTAFTDT